MPTFLDCRYNFFILGGYYYIYISKRSEKINETETCTILDRQIVDTTFGFCLRFLICCFLINIMCGSILVFFYISKSVYLKLRYGLTESRTLCYSYMMLFNQLTTRVSINIHVD